MTLDRTTPSNDPDPDRPGRLAEHERDDVAPRGAERHADADLLRPARDEVGDHAVDPDAASTSPTQPSSVSSIVLKRAVAIESRSRCSIVRT